MQGVLKKIKRNINMTDFLLLPLFTLKGYLYDFFVIRKVVKNWPDMILYRLGIKKKFVMKLRNGRKIKIEKPSDYFNFWKIFGDQKVL